MRGVLLVLLAACWAASIVAEGGGGYFWPRDYRYESTVSCSGRGSHRQDVWFDSGKNTSRVSTRDDAGEREVYGFWTDSEFFSFSYERYPGSEACRSSSRRALPSDSMPRSVIPVDEDACGPVSVGPKGNGALESFDVLCLSDDGEGNEVSTEYAVEWWSEDAFPRSLSTTQTTKRTVLGHYHLAPGDSTPADVSEPREGLRQTQTMHSYALGSVEASVFELPSACKNMQGHVARAYTAAKKKGKKTPKKGGVGTKNRE